MQTCVCLQCIQHASLVTFCSHLMMACSYMCAPAQLSLRTALPSCSYRHDRNLCDLMIECCMRAVLLSLPRCVRMRESFVYIKQHTDRQLQLSWWIYRKAKSVMSHCSCYRISSLCHLKSFTSE